jgi:hydroxymethylpyrimidine pyrophosphatase-like HAD family hydrolase
MIIAIDYDGTYSADPETFDKVIDLFIAAGHTVICVTGRSNDGVMDVPVRESIGKKVKCIFAGVGFKLEEAGNQGYKVDIWIDDRPQWIDPQNRHYEIAKRLKLG